MLAKITSMRMPPTAMTTANSHIRKRSESTTGDDNDNCPTCGSDLSSYRPLRCRRVEHPDGKIVDYPLDPAWQGRGIIIRFPHRG